MVGKNLKEILYKKFLNQLLKQAEDGIPIEAQGFMSHPEGTDMPSIEHRHGRKRPEFLDDDLEGWEQLK